jgi:hypothetical protein
VTLVVGPDVLGRRERSGRVVCNALDCLDDHVRLRVAVLKVVFRDFEGHCDVPGANSDSDLMRTDEGCGEVGVGHG